ncbi:hypothetical protein Lalb_Chr19g0124841 [Lupinus albus]|uniref:Uncharacterized protein n=1 Tax=Lupinus albus TaxID=3870 RepID=A0A6A4NRD3_LUPAL|nr:hypothetical protein Lalb_Chr19g0124841 [Lupinus albus]
MKGNSCLGSIDNLYKSLVDLEGQNYSKSLPSLKDKLVKTHLVQQFKLKNQILQFDEVPISFYSCYTVYDAPSITLFMVTDDLVVTPTSSISIISFLSMSNISPSDIDEKVISIGKKEVLEVNSFRLIYMYFHWS